MLRRIKILKLMMILKIQFLRKNKKRKKQFIKMKIKTYMNFS